MSGENRTKKIEGRAKARRHRQSSRAFIHDMTTRMVRDIKKKLEKRSH